MSHRQGAFTAARYLLVGAIGSLSVGCAASSGSPADPCVEVTCSGHGSCVDDGGSPRCSCDVGYSASGTDCLAGAACVGTALCCGSDPGCSDASDFGLFAAFTAEYPDFRSAMGFDLAGYQAWAGARMAEVGGFWTRSNMQFIWDMVEPTLGGAFDWTASFHGENIIAAAETFGVHTIAVLHSGGGGLRDPMSDLAAYQRFVQAAVERYDGDGIDDAPNGATVEVWQVGNEIGDWSSQGRSAAQYAEWFQATAAAARAADPNAKLALIASTGGGIVDPLHQEAVGLLAAAAVRFDAVDLHHWNDASLEMATMTAVPAYQTLFATHNLNNVEIISGEHGTWVGTPTVSAGQCSPACGAGSVCARVGPTQGVCVAPCATDLDCPALKPYCHTDSGLCGPPDQSYTEQARSLVYRYVLNRAQGVTRILWNNLVSWHCFAGTCGAQFDRMGLIADGFGPGEVSGHTGNKRLAFFSYQMLAARTDAPVAEQLGRIDVGNAEVYLHAYRHWSSGETAYVAWASRSITASLPWSTPAALLTSLITDAAGTPTRSESLVASAGALTVSLDGDPVWIAAGSGW